MPSLKKREGKGGAGFSINGDGTALGSVRNPYANRRRIGTTEKGINDLVQLAVMTAPP
jgi:hypothetical protein